MKNFFKMRWDVLLGLSLFALIGLTVVKSVDAGNNPTVAQTDSRRNVDYVNVYNDDNVDHEAGSVCVYVVTDSATYDGLSVSTTATANVVRVAGVVPVGETLRAGKWGRLQTFGYHPAVLTTGTVNAGDVLVTSTTGEKAAAFTLVVSTSTVGADFGVFGVALDAADTDLTETLIKVK